MFATIEILGGIFNVSKTKHQKINDSFILNNLSYICKMQFKIIDKDKKRYLDLLLLGDEQESMIDRYLEKSQLFVLDCQGVKAVFVVCIVDYETIELKNIAVYPEFQGQGFGKMCLDFIADYYRGKYRRLIVGTGEVPSTMGFYEHCGFKYSHRIKNFFTDNYTHTIIEDGIVLKDMVYLSKAI